MDQVSILGKYTAWPVGHSFALHTQASQTFSGQYKLSMERSKMKAEAISHAMIPWVQSASWLPKHSSGCSWYLLQGTAQTPFHSSRVRASRPFLPSTTPQGTRPPEYAQKPDRPQARTSVPGGPCLIKACGCAGKQQDVQSLPQREPCISGT